jgi:signal transduction histidine kinase
MVEAMNGRVWCESELGKGATFIVELPQIDHSSGKSIADASRSFVKG